MFPIFTSSTAISVITSIFAVKLIALMPATNAERSTSALRCVETYLRSSMMQVHLNNMMVVHIHKTLTDTIDVKSILTEFSTAKEKKEVFGSFELENM